MAKKILVADDAMVIVQMMKSALEKEGFEVITAFDGEEAIKKAQATLPDLIILDIMMPKLDGYSATVKLKEDEKTKNIPIIISTGKGDMREVFRMDEKVKIECYLEKPFPLPVLIDTVYKVLSK